MLNPVPLRSTCRIMRHDDRQTGLVGQALQLPFPQPAVIGVGTPAISLDQQLGRIRISRSAFSVPPAPNDTNGKFGRLVRDPHADETAIAGHIVDPIRDRFAIRIAGKIGRQHRARFAAPGPSGVLEIADQLFLLAIYANHGLFGLQKRAPFAGQIAPLPIPVRILSLAALLTIAAQRVIQPLQQTPDRFTADLELLAPQLLDQLAQRLARPLRAADRVTGGLILQQPAQRFQDIGSFFSSAGRPAPARRTPDVWSVRRMSSRPARMVTRLRPVIACANCTPPRPSWSASSPANRRRPFSSKVAITRLMA